MSTDAATNTSGPDHDFLCEIRGSMLWHLAQTNSKPIAQSTPKGQEKNLCNLTCPIRSRDEQKKVRRLLKFGHMTNDQSYFATRWQS